MHKMMVGQNILRLGTRLDGCTRQSELWLDIVVGTFLPRPATFVFPQTQKLIYLSELPSEAVSDKYQQIHHNLSENY